MPEVSIIIAGHTFNVACDDGQEPHLRAAADILDGEAQTLGARAVRLSQERLLLMAALMMADRMIGAEEEIKRLEDRLAQQSALIDELKDRPPPAPETVEVIVEVPVVPSETVGDLEAAADRVERLADWIESVAGERAQQPGESTGPTDP